MSSKSLHRSHRRSRRLAPLAGFVALALAGSSALAVTPALAQPRLGNGPGGVSSVSDDTGCVYDGYSYNTGDRIVVISGATYHTYYCGEDGNWHLTENDPGIVTKPKGHGNGVTVVIGRAATRR